MFEFEAVVSMGSNDRDFGWTVFSGMDEQCAFGAMFNSSGNIGSTLNFMPQIYRAIHNAIHSGDFERARDLQLRANRATRIAISFGFAGALHEIMAMLGIDCGGPRLPNRGLDSAQRERLRAQLNAIDFLKLAKGEF